VDFFAQIYLDGKPLYGSARAGDAGERTAARWTQRFEFAGYDGRVRVDIRPTGKWLRTHRSALPEVTLGLGVLVAIMLGATLRLTQAAGTRAAEAERLVAARDSAEQARKLASIQLQKTNEELTLTLASVREATEMKSRFLAAMSHEIRTPMAGILGMGELLLCTPLAADQRHYGEAIKESAEALLKIVSDVLDLSKIEAGKLEIEKVPFDLKTTLRAVTSILIPESHVKGLRLRCEVAPDVPQRVIGDPGRVRQVLLNLAGNAVKFTERGRVTVDVSVDARDGERDVIRFAVRDTGIGIPEGETERIFEEFVQADTSTTRRFGGTGLGLSISRHLVEMMGARSAVRAM